MEQLEEFLKNNPQMKLKDVSKIYGISVSTISRKRSLLGIKHETGTICKQIATMLHKRNIEIAKIVGCSQQLVAHVRFLNKIPSFNRKIELTPEQIKIVKENYDKMTISKLAEKIGVTIHVLRARMIKLNLYKETSIVNFYDYDLDNGNGFFDLEKYKQIMW
jgi:hypothetical protein